VHVISKKPFNQAAKDHPNQRKALEDVYRVLCKGAFASPEALRRVFPSLDNFKYQKKWWVINIAGNHLRLIAYIHFAHKRMYVKNILTHAEYDRLCWRYSKGDLR